MWATPPAGLCFSSTSTKSRNNSWGRQHTHTASHQLSPCLITHTHWQSHFALLSRTYSHICHFHILPTCTHTYTHFCFVFFPRPSHTLTHSQQFSLCPLSLSSSDTHSLAGFCQMPGCPRGRRAVVVSEMWVSLAPLSAWCETHVSVECACHFQGVKHFCTVKMTGVPETQAPSQNVRPLACSKFCSKFY